MIDYCRFCCTEGPKAFDLCYPTCGRASSYDTVCSKITSKPEPKDIKQTDCTLCEGYGKKTRNQALGENLRNSVKDDSQKNQTIPSPIVPSTDKNFETACEKCRGDKLERGKRRLKKKKEPKVIESDKQYSGDLDKENTRSNSLSEESEELTEAEHEKQSEVLGGSQISPACSEFYDVEFYRSYFQWKKKLAEEASIHRGAWRKQQLKLKIHIEKIIAHNAGPEWFQDLSNLQMKLIDSVPETIMEDQQKGTVRGIQLLLYEFGIYPKLNSSLLKKCMEESEADPIKFLFLVHREVSKMETEDYEREFFQAKQAGKQISPFSLNERLLLSGVFHVHFDTFLKKLEDILPPGYKPPKILLGKKVLKPKTKLPSCPYLQPQPINEKSWIEERAEAEYVRKILRDQKFREEMSTREKYKKEMDLKEREKKFQEKTDDLVQRAHSAEIKGMLNPQPPSKESLKEKGKPTREHKNVVVQRMYPSFKVIEEEEEQEHSTGIPRLDRLIKYQEISPKLSTHFENQKQNYEKKIIEFTAKFEELEKLAAEKISEISETSTETEDDDSFLDDEESDSDSVDDDDKKSIRSDVGSGSKENELMNDNVEIFEKSVEQIGEPAKLKKVEAKTSLNELGLFNKVSAPNEETNKVSLKDTEERSIEKNWGTERIKVHAYKSDKEKFIDDLMSDEETLKSVVFNGKDSLFFKLKRNNAKGKEVMDKRECLCIEEVVEDEEATTKIELIIDMLFEIIFANYLWGDSEDSLKFERGDKLGDDDNGDDISDADEESSYEPSVVREEKKVERDKKEDKEKDLKEKSDKQNIVQDAADQLIDVDTSPLLSTAKAFADVPDNELFFELEDGIAEDYVCGRKMCRATQTDTTEIVCDLKEVIRPFKKLRTVLHDDYVDQHIDLSHILDTQDSQEKAITLTKEEPDKQIASPKFLTSGFVELPLDPDTGEVIRDLEEEEREREEAVKEMEKEMEKEIQNRVIDLLEEEVESDGLSEIFMADKGVIERDRAVIKAALPPTQESTSAAEAEEEKSSGDKKETEEKDCKFSHKPLNVECLERDCALIDESELPINEYTLARKMLLTVPIEARLKAAIKYLADKGDPLAILPDIHKVPWITRWYEKRRGIKLKLTPKDNEVLMNLSQTLWLAQYDSVDKVPLKSIEKSNLTWKNVRWLRKRSAQILDKYQYALKAVMVTNARNYFPTMFCEYYNKPFMKRFREVFFTYLPGRPNDAYTLRPWQKMSKSTE
ncbi:uncharacterized protein isoform X3 [Rhodnius prolixus]|uniref:uncharacterized protein isoform X3 n=1 Tax=Rhodnius prolixus TaxID=13249 RepID=UPI003D188837